MGVVGGGQNGPVAATLVAHVRAALAAADDPDRAHRQQRYMRSAMPFHGVPMAQVRAITSELLGRYPLSGAAQWQATVRELWDSATHREQRYAALALVRHRTYRPFRTPDALGLLRHLVLTGAWWDVVDEIAAHPVGEVLRDQPHAVVPVLRAWATEEDLWLRRTAILSQLRAKDATDTALLAHCLRANLTGSDYGDEFFIRKAVGWALREYAKTDPDWVREFLTTNRHHLSALSVREAGKHLRS